ncbi:hypothetical protein Slala02_54330 [Streptomyces lavendulae subsp. lavendulae]|nr:hypothetical protein Slala01_07500 [Streptomyces lavendulae subsp. lavendulae]GLX29613.1 hypothetical protein Slala02_54330 [Streptomyces lavendulae subsp. lavendulae]
MDGWVSGTCVVTLAASLNAAGRAPARGGADPPPIVCARGTDLSTVRTARPVGTVRDPGRCLTKTIVYCSSSRMNAHQRLVSRGHIDFGRVWSAACRA